MKRLIAASIAVLFTGATVAQEVIAQPPQAVVSKVSSMFEGQAQAIKYFTAPDNLIAIGVVTRDFKQQVYYTNQTGDFVLSGMMYDVNAKVNFNNEVIAQVPVELPETLTAGIQDLPAAIHGEGEQVVYAIVDANCGYCKRFYQKIESQMAAGQLTNVSVKYIPVGMLGQDSKVKAEAIMSLPEAERFAALQAAVNRQPITMTTSEEGQSLVAQNKAFMDQFPFISGVPFVLTQLNGEWRMDRGLPNDGWFTMLAQVANPTPPTAATTGN